MITAQFFLSNHHNQVLIGHPSCDRLGAYTLHTKNLAPKFDQNKLLPQLSEVQQTAPEEGPITRVEDLMRRYPDCFDVIGKFEGEYHMVTDPNVPPSQHAMRKVPIEYQEKIVKELDRMEEQGIITKVTEPREWVNSITYPVKPNGDLCICLDPKDTTQLQSFLGMVNFMHNFIPHLSQHTATLRSLLSKNAVFHWDESTNAAFQKLKSLIGEAQKRSLKFYNRNLPLTVQADASKHGLGAALLQQGQLVAFASKSLSDTEKRYANIERELLSVVFTCEHFQTYLLGREFTVENNHKPLEMIALKNLVAAPPRLQRILLRLQPFDCNIKYKPGKEMLLADALSRLPSPANTTIELHMRIDHHGFTTNWIRQIEAETSTDPILSIVNNLH